MSAPALLEVKHLTRDYALRTPQGLSSGKVLRAVSDVSFTLEQGLCSGSSARAAVASRRSRAS